MIKGGRQPRRHATDADRQLLKLLNGVGFVGVAQACRLEPRGPEPRRGMVPQRAAQSRDSGGRRGDAESRAQVRVAAEARARTRA